MGYGLEMGLKMLRVLRQSITEDSFGLWGTRLALLIDTFCPILDTIRHILA